VSEQECDIRLIEPGDKLAGLSLGHKDFSPLKNFLRYQAHSFHRRGLGRTYGAFVEGKIVGYITLVCGQVSSEDQLKSKAEVDDFTYTHFPSVKIARLAVDKRYRGCQLGRRFINLSFGIVREEICPRIGCRFMIVDVKKSAVKFYEKCGFTILDTPDNKRRPEPVMFVDLHRINVMGTSSECVNEDSFQPEAANAA
jgi:GNAT superfamily N-acetyltransferase